MNQFQEEKKPGGQELILNFQRKLESDVENKYNEFKQENDNKRRQFEVCFNVYHVFHALILMSNYTMNFIYS